MKPLAIILFLLLTAFAPQAGTGQPVPVNFDFFGDSIQLKINDDFKAAVQSPVTEAAVLGFYNQLDKTDYNGLVSTLKNYKQQYKLDDWLYFQLLRRTAQAISPKAENYERYTLYKWFLLNKSGYNARLKLSSNKILLYVQSDEEIFEIPCYNEQGKQFVCLNYHDYGGNIDFKTESFTEVPVLIDGATGSFSYRVSKLPDFKPQDYVEKDLHFTYFNSDYSFKVKMNPQVTTIFKNYPIVDYEACFNIPLSKETYNSLIPVLKQNIKGMNTRNGIDYLMRFTRYAFLFEKDKDQFGIEKRMTPEQTLVYQKSDCEDRASLFYFLVKEIYNAPMIVLVYPEHVTIGVKFDKPFGSAITYNGSKYTICEPTPQSEDLAIGELLPSLRKEKFQVAFEYKPSKGLK